jgi:hypothetical protein
MRDIRKLAPVARGLRVLIAATVCCSPCLVVVQ